MPSNILWTPESIETALWLDAADLTTITIDTGVSEWLDKSGNLRHATQSTPTYQPVISDFNGQSVISFDGINDQFDILVPQATPSTIFTVLRTGSLQTDYRVFLNRETTGTPTPPAIYLSSTTNTPAVYWGSSALNFSTAYRTDYMASFSISDSFVGFRANGVGADIFHNKSQLVILYKIICTNLIFKTE